MAKISIIVPVYKVEPYLRRCVDSILAQTFSDFELILVDDGSPDNCPAICDDYAKKDSRVNVIHQENCGVSAARNTGIVAAMGEYLYFVDSDDYIAPDLLKTVIPVMECGSDMVVFAHTVFYESDKKRDNTIARYNKEWNLQTEQERMDFLHGILLRGRLGWEVWNRIFRRSIVVDNGVRFAEGIPIAEDLHFVLCYCAKAGRIVSIQNNLYYHLNWENSVMNKNTRVFHLRMMEEVVNAVYSYWKSQEDCQFLLPFYHYLYFSVVGNEITVYSQNNELTSKEIRRACFKETGDSQRLRRQARKILRDKNLLVQYIPYGRVLELMSLWQYILDGIYPLHVIKNRFIYKNYKKLNQKTAK